MVAPLPAWRGVCGVASGHCPELGEEEIPSTQGSECAGGFLRKFHEDVHECPLPWEHDLCQLHPYNSCPCEGYQDTKTGQWRQVIEASHPWKASKSRSGSQVCPCLGESQLCSRSLLCGLLHFSTDLRLPCVPMMLRIFLALPSPATKRAGLQSCQT